jgi:hypothetical protein
MAFQGMREPARAIRSLELAVSQSPNFHEAKHQLELLKKSREMAGGSEDLPRRHEGTK